MIGTLWNKVLRWLFEGRHSTYGLAIMRIGFGAMTLAILALYLPNYSYSFGEGSRWGEALYKTSSAQEYIWPISSLFSREDSDQVLYVKVAILAALALAYMLGWRMRVIGPLFVVAWLGYISVNPVILNTGHYQTFRVLLLFLLLADTSRRWSLDARRRRLKGEPPPLGIAGRRLPRWAPVLSNNIAVILIAAQLCVIYISSALWKLKGSMWTDGVAVYYPLQVQELTVFGWLNDLASQVTPLVFVATWLSVYMQLLFPFMLLNRRTRIVGLVIITCMHAGIAVLLALPWFSLMMMVSDMIFVRDVTWRRAESFVGERVRQRRRRRPPRADLASGAASEDVPSASSSDEAPAPRDRRSGR